MEVEEEEEAEAEAEGRRVVPRALLGRARNRLSQVVCGERTFLAVAISSNPLGSIKASEKSSRQCAAPGSKSTRKHVP